MDNVLGVVRDISAAGPSHVVSNGYIDQSKPDHLCEAGGVHAFLGPDIVGQIQRGS